MGKCRSLNASPFYRRTKSGPPQRRDDYVLLKLVQGVGVQSGSSRLIQHIGPLQPRDLCHAAVSDFKKHMDYVFWVIMLVVGCGVIYSLGKLLYQSVH